MERQGSLWGARQEVIEASIAALNELIELVATLDLTRKAMQLEMKFDEFSLDFTLTYAGLPLNLSQDQEAVSSLDEEVSIARLALRLLREKADWITVSEIDGQQQILLHFDH